MMSSYSPSPSHPSTSKQPSNGDDASQRFVIGKIDAGIAVLISDSVHLIEFPSLLLPPGVGPGSIVNIACSRNVAAEKQHARDFWDLQQAIFDEFGAEEPSPPKLRVRNTTQTSVTLEWDKLDLASASLISLSMYRNGQRLTTIPNPLSNTSTKLSGLQLDTDYSFHLVLKTTAGTFSSPIVKTRTHTIDNTTGISVCFGLVQPDELLEEAQKAVREMGAKASETLQIDTTHFVATSSASRSNPQGGPGVEYQKAVQLSIPVVSPEWLLACHRSQKLVPISAYYLGQTNPAASLSSADLLSNSTTNNTNNRQPTAVSSPSPQQHAGRALPPAAAAPPPPPVVLEEPEQPEQEVQLEVAPAPPPVQLEENVEEPPRESPAPADAEDSPATGGGETDSSTQAVKSETEPEVEAVESNQEAKPDAPAEELVAELKEDVKEEKLAEGEAEQEKVEAAAEEVGEPAASAGDEDEGDAPAPARVSVEDDTDTPKASATFEQEDFGDLDESSAVPEGVEAKDAADAGMEEKEELDAKETGEEDVKDEDVKEADEQEDEPSLVDIKL
ncbi:hypothetical protein JCM8547_009144 [Rhodosporidiobolus lusitaniae]